jgi:hypothetical protein
MVRNVIEVLGRYAVLPDRPGFAGQPINRTRFGAKREALPIGPGGPAKPEIAGGPQRQPEYLTEMRLVAVPSDADADRIFGAEYLTHQRSRAAELLDGFRERFEPRRYRLGRLHSAMRIVVAKAERLNPPLALVGAKLKRLKRQCGYLPDQLLFERRRDELLAVAQSLRIIRLIGEQGELIGRSGQFSGRHFADIGVRFVRERACKRHGHQTRLDSKLLHLATILGL